MNKPKVLVVGVNPWIDNTGINTLINFFKDWGKDALALIYTRDGFPNSVICDKFFRISESALINSIFGKTNRTGEIVYNTAKGTEKAGLYKKKKHSAILAFAREMVWTIGYWKTPELKAFIDDYNPDVLFFPVYSTVYMNRLQNFIADYTGKPVILYASDDNYSYKSISHTPIDLILRFWLRQHEKELFKRANKILVITPKQKEEYDGLFHTDCAVLTKGIEFGESVYKTTLVRHPIRMVYTGKTIIGRWKSIAEIASAMGVINAETEKVQLDIYTIDPLTKHQRKQMNRNGCRVKGALSLEEVKAVQEKADVLVFVESLDRKYRYRARLSFSTKLTDYMRAGKCIFAIGDREIAPIDYLKRNEAAVVASSYAEIQQQLSLLCDQPELVSEYGKKAYECGVRNHSAEKQKRVLFDAISEVLCNN